MWALGQQNVGIRTEIWALGQQMWALGHSEMWALGQQMWALGHSDMGTETYCQM